MSIRIIPACGCYFVVTQPLGIKVHDQSKCLDDEWERNSWERGKRLPHHHKSKKGAKTWIKLKSLFHVHSLSLSFCLSNSCSCFLPHLFLWREKEFVFEKYWSKDVLAHLNRENGEISYQFPVRSILKHTPGPIAILHVVIPLHLMLHLVPLYQETHLHLSSSPSP